jgi:nucleoside phosphorylase
VPGQVVIADRVVLADAMVLQGRASFPDPMAVSVETHRVITSALVGAGMRKVGIASPLGSTTDLAVASAFAMRLGCDVEYPEAFGVGLACAPTQVPFVSVLGVSHEIGPNARETWRVSHRGAGFAAAGLVMSWIQSGAAGLAHRSSLRAP